MCGEFTTSDTRVVLYRLRNAINFKVLGYTMKGKVKSTLSLWGILSSNNDHKVPNNSYPDVKCTPVKLVDCMSASQVWSVNKQMCEMRNHIALSEVKRWQKVVVLVLGARICLCFSQLVWRVHSELNINKQDEQLWKWSVKHCEHQTCLHELIMTLDHSEVNL